MVESFYGEELFSSEPFVCIVSKDQRFYMKVLKMLVNICVKFRFKRCSFCFKSGRMIMCNHCCFVIHCSQTCQESDFDHQLECHYIKKDSSLTEMSRLLLRLLLKIHSNSENNEISFEDKLEYHRMDYSLEKEIEETYGSLIKLIPESLPPYENFVTLFRKVFLNSFSIFGEYDQTLGLSLYLNQVNTNHSCCPNAEVTFTKNILRITSKTHTRSKFRETQTIAFCDRTQKYSERNELITKMFGSTCACHMCSDFVKLKGKMSANLNYNDSFLRKCYMSEIEDKASGKCRSYFCSLRFIKVINCDRILHCNLQVSKLHWVASICWLQI